MGSNEHTLFSVGLGARSFDEFQAVLRSAGIELLVDVRSRPGSRKHPHFARDVLSDGLEHAGISYIWRPDLGGFRKPAPDSPHTALESTAFRGYADHMDTQEFDQPVEWLIRSAEVRLTAFMCAETMWWRCHRRMISDALTARGCTVEHLMTPRQRQPHARHPASRVDGYRVVYDVGPPEQQTLTGT